MANSVLIAHSPEDTDLAEQIAAALQTLSAATAACCSTLQSSDGQPHAGNRAARLAESEAVIALLTPRSASSPDVLLQLGAGWGLGKRLVLLLDGRVAPVHSALPLLPAQRVMLDAESLIELAETLANTTGGRAELGPAAKLVLTELFPNWGPTRQSSEHPIARPELGADQTQEMFPVQPTLPAPTPAAAAPPHDTPEPAEAPAARERDVPSWPRASASVEAGRLLADAVSAGEELAADPDALDLPFGAFLASLGGNWSSLREIGDAEVWREATENVLESLPKDAQPTRGWFEIGFYATLLLQLARRQLELEGSDETLERQWQEAWSALREGAWRAGLSQTVVDELHAMLDNLRGPLRDYTNLGRAQARVRELASQAER